MALLIRLLNSARFRLKLARLGAYTPAQRKKLTSLLIAGKRVQLRFPAGEDDTLGYEMWKVVVDDCYRLAACRGVGSVLDIGANIGLFGLAARYHFPAATIHCYEPNVCLAPYLKAHLEPLNVARFMEAVGLEDGAVSLTTTNDSMMSRATNDPTGTVPKVAFRKAVERIGRLVGLLKLDCEGAEWEILQDRKAMQSVSNLTMEYHLWAKEGSNTEELIGLVESSGLHVTAVEPSPNGPWGFLTASRTSRKRRPAKSNNANLA